MIKWEMNNGARSSGMQKRLRFRIRPGFLARCMAYFTVFAICFPVVRAQTPGKEQLTGTWIGVHSEWDTDLVCPLPTYMRLETKGNYTLGLVDGSASPMRSTWGVQHDSVRLDTVHYAPTLVSRQGNLLRIGIVYPMVFRLFQDISIDSSSAYRQLAGRVWQADSLVISLFADGRVSLENPATRQRTAHFWRLARFESSVFLVIQGSQYNRDSNYKPLWQVVGVAANQFQAIGWNGRAVTTERFALVRPLAPGDSCYPNGFQTCDNCFSRMWYDHAPGNSSDRYEMQQLFTKQYCSVDLPGQSGLLRIRFVINCAGERGQFDVAGFDRDYCNKTFDSRITDQLLTICRNYTTPDQATRISDQREVRPNDVALSFAFRLDNGRLTDVLP